eukprot:CAMPEP_0170562770 /NCGR_PEP_ID=MMETSP0211-20121228/62381_1 /TAXON_ID=311385 /ORGANISM="Pseudokeronopsis sp., Strain OXSARD2" /LENGTH=70 /DNA_ID=CAMNT_0010880099 /DNA_START=147 /DNA_END=355 /DNA_ORIENTATION=+
MGRVGDEELGAIGVSPTVGHTDHTPPLMLQVSHQLISKMFSIYAFTAFAGACGVASLEDEAFDVSVELGA